VREWLPLGVSGLGGGHPGLLWKVVM
jgi:hypothetical protein